MSSIFELETGVAYGTDNQLIVCHICNMTFSPVKVIIIPTDLCAYYSNTYKRMCAIYYISGNVCTHVKFPDGNWGSIFLGDIECIPPTILSKFEDVLSQQPNQEQAQEAWTKAVNKYKERLNNVEIHN